MDISNIKSYEQLADYLRGFRNWRGDVAPYDFGGVAHLLGALLDNIHAQASEAEVEDIQARLSPEQVETWRRLAAHIRS